MFVTKEEARAIRKGLSYTQKDFAALLKVGLRTYHCYEAGEFPIPENIGKQILLLKIESQPQLLDDLAEMVKLKLKPEFENIYQQLHESTNRHIETSTKGIKKSTGRRKIN